MPIARAEPRARSMMRPPAKGPRSFTCTTTELALPPLTILSFVPNGREGWAAARPFGLKRSPLTVRKLDPYQDAMRRWHDLPAGLDAYGLTGATSAVDGSDASGCGERRHREEGPASKPGSGRWMCSRVCRGCAADEHAPVGMRMAVRRDRSSVGAYSMGLSNPRSWRKDGGLPAAAKRDPLGFRPDMRSRTS
jgi:hypothetical protein